MKNKQLFVPDQYVPISEYQYVEGTGITSQLRIAASLLSYLLQSTSKLYVAFCAVDRDQVVYIDEIRVDQLKQVIEFQSIGSGSYTVVTEILYNRYPISTHWSATINKGRGGPLVGATDSLGMISYKKEDGARITEGWFRDTDEDSPYYFASDQYALFAAEQDGEYERTPAYERYVGENYSLYGVTSEAVLQLSAETLSNTGFPVVVRESWTEVMQLEQIPAFQLVHNYVIGHEGKQSLVTYILPPFWKQTMIASYPALFSGFYDQNENVFSTIGPSMLQTIGDIYQTHNCGVVGIIWNGGGSIGTRTLQQSIYNNLNQLFALAVEQFGVNPDAIVSVGGSRGGITSLLAAANPSCETYKIAYAVCYNVPFIFGSPLVEMMNSSYPVLPSAMCEDIGYKYAWQKNWRDSNGKTGLALFLETSMGSDDLVEIDQMRAPSAVSVIERIRNNGTKIWLNHGTHDPFNASWLSFQWVDQARKLGIAVRHEIGYRYGHNNSTDPFESARKCLASIITGNEQYITGDFHYGRATELAHEWNKSKLLEVTRQPVFFEGPKIAIKNLPNLFVIYGEPGLEYSLKLYATDPSDPKTEEILTIMEGTLEEIASSRPGFSYAKAYVDITKNLEQQIYYYDLHYKHAEDSDWRHGAVYTPQPDYSGVATLELLMDQPNPLDGEWLDRTLQHVIGWGLSEV